MMLKLTLVFEKQPAMAPEIVPVYCTQFSNEFVLERRLEKINGQMQLNSSISSTLQTTTVNLRC